MDTKNLPWTQEQLIVLNETDELKLMIAGKTVTIWMVSVENQLFVRSVYGRKSKWFQRALGHTYGEISAGRIRARVGWLEPDERFRDSVDEAFRSKYRHYPKSIVDSTVTPIAQGASLQIVLLEQPESDQS
ncbi:DUF2255 family protein [bacterium]|nr:DUF2255 family protein [bacterium]